MPPPLVPLPVIVPLLVTIASLATPPAPPPWLCPYKPN
jgi:hypothetical protein